MPDHDPSKPTPPSDVPPLGLRGLDPGELLARGMDTVKLSGGADSWEPPTPEALGRILPQYLIERLIGRGGMGAVYKGSQVVLDRPVAIKLLPAEIAADERFIARFHREARTLARLKHSRIITIYDFGQTSEGHLYFVMEHIDGTDLRRVLRGPGLGPEQALVVIGQICDALHAAHTQGVIHRDVKPENILITSDGDVKLADFGLSRPLKREDVKSLTGTHVVMGTEDYMAPEQREGQADERADIFALGVMLYEMLTGRPPRGAFAPASQKTGLDARIDKVVLKALQAEPELRYQRVSEMKSDVDLIRNTPVPPPAPPNAGRRPIPAPPAGKKGRTIATAALALALILAIAGLIVWARNERLTSDERIEESELEAVPARLAGSMAGKREVAPANEPNVAPAAEPSPPVGAPKAPLASEPVKSAPAPSPIPAPPMPLPAVSAVPPAKQTFGSYQEAALLGHAWSWDTVKRHGSHLVIRFFQDGRVSSRWHWQWLPMTNGELVVDCFWGPDQHLYLRFDKQFTEFRAYGKQGVCEVTGKRLGPIDQSFGVR